jgi:hypothetical protein
MTDDTSVNNLPSIKPRGRQGGRQLGSHNKRDVFVDRLFNNNNSKDVREVVATAVKRAKEDGNDMTKLILDRVAPAPKGARVMFAWSDGVGFDAFYLHLKRKPLIYNRSVRQTLQANDWQARDNS